MKLKYAVVSLTLGSLLALTGGCSKSEPAPPSGAVDKTTKEEHTTGAKAVDKLSEAAKPVLQQASNAVAQATNAAAKLAADTTAQATNAAAKPVTDAAAQATNSAAKVVADATGQLTNATAKLTAGTTAKLADTSAKAGTQAQGLIDQAKTLVSQSKYQAAVDALQKLSSLKLTSEQQTAVDDLKAQIQKYLADHATSEGAKAIGSLLGK